MEEILALQEELAAAQHSSTSQRLSDRNIVELVMKLQSLNLINLIFTRTGKEYLTHPQLTLEIKDEIQAHGGRVNLIDLPDVLNVDLHHIQGKISEIVQPDHSVRLVRGEIITDYYLSTLVEEVDDALTTAKDGTDEIGAIATRYSLPVEIVKEALTSFKGSIDATYDVDSGTLRSPSSIAREHAAACGTLRAITLPTLLTEVAKHHRIHFSTIRKVADELLAKGELHAVITGSGSRATFVPNMFSAAASALITTAFSSIGFVHLERMRNLFLSDTKQFVVHNLKGGVILKDCVVGPLLVETLSTTAAEAMENNGWLDVASSLPPDFPSQDIPQVARLIANNLHAQDMAEIPAGEKSKVVNGRRKGKLVSTKQDRAKQCPCIFGDRFIAAPKILEAVTEVITRDAVTKAAERAKVMSERTGIVVSQSISAPKELADGRLKEGKKLKGKGRRRAAGKDQSSRKSSTVEGKGSDPFPVVVPSTEEFSSIVMAEQSLSTVLKSDYLEVSCDGEEMIACILEKLFDVNTLQNIYETKAAEAVATFERERALAKQQLERELLTGLEHAQLFFKAAATLPCEGLVKESRVWVTDYTCLETLCKVIEVVAQNIGVGHAELRQFAKGLSKREKIELLRNVCERFPPTIATKVRSFIKTVSGKEESSTNDFLSLYDDCTAFLDLPERRPVEKRGERATFANMRNQIMLSLDEGSTVSEIVALHTAVVLTHAKCSGGSIISFPQDSTIAFAEAIEQNTRPPEIGKALKELREALKSNVDAVPDETETSSKWSEKFAEKMTGLQQYIR